MFKIMLLTPETRFEVNTRTYFHKLFLTVSSFSIFVLSNAVSKSNTFASSHVCGYLKLLCSVNCVTELQKKEKLFRTTLRLKRKHKKRNNKSNIRHKNCSKWISNWILWNMTFVLTETANVQTNEVYSQKEAGQECRKKVLHVDYNPYYGSHFANMHKKHYELYISGRHRELLELHSCGRRDEKSSSTGEAEGEEAKQKEDFSLKEVQSLGKHTKKALVGNEDIDYIGMEYLSDAKSKWNVYGNFEWKDFGPELKELIHPKNERKRTMLPFENKDVKEKEKEKEQEQEHLTENLNEIQYVEHMKQVIEIYENKYRQISIDLIPNLVYANESFVDILVRSQVSRYVEFRGIVHNFVFFDGDKPSKVPLSKGEVFASKDLGMREKRQLMKFMHSVLDDSSNPTNQMAIDLHQQSVQQQSFIDVMNQQQLSTKVQDFIKYALAFLDSPSGILNNSTHNTIYIYILEEGGSKRNNNNKKDCPTVAEMLKRLQLYFQSMGRFCEGAFLFPLYGCGDLAQGFCRASAVKGGVFILNWTIQGMVVKKPVLPLHTKTEQEVNSAEHIEKENMSEYISVVTPAKQVLKSTYLVCSLDYLSKHIGDVTTRHIRMTVLSDGPLQGTISDPPDPFADNDEWKKQRGSHNGVIHIPPATPLFQNPCSIHIIQLDHTSLVVPDGLCFGNYNYYSNIFFFFFLEKKESPLAYLTYMWTLANQNNIEESRQTMKRCFELLYRNPTKHKQEHSDKPTGLFYCLYEQRFRSVNTQHIPRNVFVVRDLDDTLSYENVVQQ
ncbi:hypothetical protein RFI_26675, partial [Reticulomyxa filosa]